MRRATLPILAGLLAITGFAANAPLVLAAGTLVRLSAWQPSSIVAVFVALAAVSLDVVAWARPASRVFRPVAVNRQVPQWYGHVYGPWRAAARYGLRLGVGPATILNTWAWWGGFLIAVTRGSGAMALCAITFVSARTLITITACFGPRDGAAMARRAATVDEHRVHAQVASLVVVLVVAALVAFRLGARR